MKNPYLCLTIVYMLGACAGLCILGMSITSATGHESPSALLGLAGTCIGSLASFLVNVPRGSAGGPPLSDKEATASPVVPPPSK